MIAYELRDRDSGEVAEQGGPFGHTFLRTPPHQNDEQWQEVEDAAAALSGSQCKTYDVFRIEDGEEAYIVTMCGGGPYWWPPDADGGMHQVGSLGACWDCWNEGLGWIRHPVTPAQVLGGVGVFCGALAVFWADTVDAEEAECLLDPGHDPADRHQNQRTGTWVEADVPGVHDEAGQPGRIALVYELPTHHV